MALVAFVKTGCAVAVQTRKEKTQAENERRISLEKAIVLSQNGEVAMWWRSLVLQVVGW